jgi:predicted Ser/Thr protein kinase
VNPPFRRDTLVALPRQLLREGRWANARVYRVEVGQIEWVVKDFAPRPWIVRSTIGRLLIVRELRALARLHGLDGIAATAFRVDAHALAVLYLAGTPVNRAAAERLNGQYFAALESLFHAIHARGIVHLDTRGGGNMLITDDGRPALIDFQSALQIGLLPRRWQRWLADLDMTGVYKRWLKHDPESLGAARLELYQRMTRRRRLWVVRGYAGFAKSPPEMRDQS